MRRPANHSTHVETGRRMRRPYEALSPALSAGGFQTPRYHFQTAAIKGPSYFVGATHASPCKPQHACRNGATHASPRSFVTGPICGRGSNPPLSGFTPPLSKVPLTSQGDACVALQTTARMSKRGDACVAPTKLCHRPYLRAGFKPPAISFKTAAIKGPSYFVGARHCPPPLCAGCS